MASKSKTRGSAGRAGVTAGTTGASAPIQRTASQQRAFNKVSGMAQAEGWRTVDGGPVVATYLNPSTVVPVRHGSISGEVQYFGQEPRAMYVRVPTGETITYNILGGDSIPPTSRVRADIKASKADPLYRGPTGATKGIPWAPGATGAPTTTAARARRARQT